jgi:hypothetical protein
MVPILSSYDLIAFLGIIVAIVTIFVFVRSFNIKVGPIELARNQLEAETEEVRRRLEQGQPDASPEDRQYLLAREYHAQGLVQSKISFWFSLIFASIGFAVIIIAIFNMDRNAQFAQQGQTFITLISGTIIEAVSALFFVQSNRARRLMAEFFDKLRIDRKLEESLRLATQIPDEILQSRLKIILALSFVEVKWNDDFLSSFLNTEIIPNAHKEGSAGEHARDGGEAVQSTGTLLGRGS